MAYILPNDVQPKKVVNVIYDGGPPGVSLAEINWNGGSCIGIRWNETDSQRKRKVKVSKGMPISSGNAVWFILPDDMFDSNSILNKEIMKVIQKNAGGRV